MGYVVLFITSSYIGTEKTELLGNRLLLQCKKQLEYRLQPMLETKSVIPALLLQGERWRQETPLAARGPTSLQYAASIAAETRKETLPQDR